MRRTGMCCNELAGLAVAQVGEAKGVKDVSENKMTLLDWFLLAMLAVVAWLGSTTARMHKEQIKTLTERVESLEKSRG
jgi:cyanate permease